MTLVLNIMLTSFFIAIVFFLKEKKDVLEILFDIVKNYVYKKGLVLPSYLNS